VTSKWHALWLTLAALLALTAIDQWAYRPPAARPADAPAAEFSARRAAAVLRELIGAGIPHPLASPADAQIRAQLVRHLNELGIVTELQKGWACDVVLACGWVVNVIGHIDGTEPDGGSVLLAAHYDSVPAGPGAGDDGVGVASILEIARVLKQQPAQRHPIILLIDEGEETGLLGARLFVGQYPGAHTVRAAVNLDARGDSGPSLMFETGAATDWTLRLFAGAVARPMSNSLYYFIYKLIPNDTDFTVFKAAGYQGLNFALIGDVERYHTPLDRLENLDLASLQHQGQNALAAVQALARSDLSAHPATGAVFFDVLGRTLWIWPASWSVALGLLITAALAWALWTVKQRARVSAVSIVYALGALMAGWAGAALVCALLLTVLRVSAAVPSTADGYSWAAYPLGMHAACIALALLAPACAVKLYRRRIDAWSLWLAAVKLNALLALLSALKFPEISYMFFSPALAALVASLVALPALRNAPARPPIPPLVAALPMLGAAFTFLPILVLLYAGLGADAWPVITALAGLGLLGLAPLLIDTPARNYRVYLCLSALTAVLGWTVAMLSPEYSTRMPQRTLLWYTLNADTGVASWRLQPDSQRLPPQLALRSPGPTLPPILPAGNIKGSVAATAPRINYPPPEMSILGIERRADGARYHVHVRSPRGAPEIELTVADDRPIRATVDVADQKLPAKFWRATDGGRWLQLVGVGPEGLDLTLDTANTGEVALTLLDRSYGVPGAGATLRHPAPAVTTASQDGDLTIVYRSVRLGALQNSPGS
jgi:Peptidase family M28